MYTLPHVIDNNFLNINTALLGERNLLNQYMNRKLKNIEKNSSKIAQGLYVINYV